MNSFDRERLAAIIATATQDVFSTMLGMEVVTEPAFSETAGAAIFDGIIGLIGMTGDWTGASRICASASLACRISAALLMADYPSVNEEVLDAMAELTNMIVGNVKTALEEELGPMALSIPTVIFGRNYQARSAGVSEWLVVPFRCGEARLEVKMFIAPAAETRILQHEQVMVSPA